MIQLKELPPERQVQVLKLHQEIFSNSACTTCKGACCHSCHTAKGYLGLSAEKFKKFTSVYPFDPKMGFKTETGCSLPIRERSDICLSFMCSGDKRQWERYGSEGPAVTRPFTKIQWDKSKQMKDLFLDEPEKVLRNPVISEWPF